MQHSKVFMKKTKRGSILKIVREHYLRDDIWCGSSMCNICLHESTPLQANPSSASSVCQSPHYLIVDTNVVLHQMDVLDDEHISNVIILTTVLEEVRRRSTPAYKRIKDLITNPEKHFYTFVNEFHKDTYVERQPKESSNDRNDRAIRQTASWYQSHLNELEDCNTKIVLITNDRANKEKAKEEGITAFTVREYVKGLGIPELLDRLANLDKGSQAHAGDNIQYPEHKSLAEIQRGVKSGRYKQGKFHLSRENYLEANVMVNDDDKDDSNSIFLQGAYSINRSVSGDIVAVEMLPEEEWTCPSSMMLEEEEEEEKADEEIGTEDDLLEKESKAKVRKKIGPKQPTGKVVGIIKRNWRQYCGILQPSVLKRATRHLVIPAEKRIPKIRIETRQAESLVGQRIIVQIDSWPRNSRYPQGHFVRKLGAIGDKETENQVLLLEHDVPHSKFSENVLRCLPSVPWTITEQDLKYREDLRHITVCSVDPPGCTDIDDALHCRNLDNGNLEVGVHIADVSHFIRPNTAIDDEASNRGTTVYLVDKRIDMVPELLSSNLCSLRDDGDRLAFSVLWEMTNDAKIVNTRFTKSCIRSKASLTYAQAQLIIDETSRNDELATSLRGLNRLAKILKQGRIDKGALVLASTEIRFHIDSETHDPIDVETKQLRDTNSMVEEFMLLANISVAEKIKEDFPNCAVLRRHPSPPPSNFDPLIKAAQSKGFQMDINSGKALQVSLNEAVIPDNPYFNTMLRILTTRCMMQALYFCSGMVPESDFGHYGLAAPIYTHFTSPIRRYSDILAHRLLAVAIGQDASYADLLNKKKTHSCCDNLNYRHRMAQYAGRASVALHTQLFFKKRTVDEEAYVLFVRKNAVQVLIPKYGLEGTLYVSKSGEKSEFEFNEENFTQTAHGVTLHTFDPLIVQLSIDASNVQHQKLSIKLVKPVIPGFSVDPAPTEMQVEDGPKQKKLKKI
ncbi:unnamed protein product [Owenia fusiformis]|uniref:Protein DIS3 homolog n=1 Tax=Owenia fusiformis TaxID=6347 RepID=A0A8J1XNA6_OWEFU|nr:unnamed protein product [Owenia fusiformis]